jgi:hypothetical protein
MKVSEGIRKCLLNHLLLLRTWFVVQLVVEGGDRALKRFMCDIFDLSDQVPAFRGCLYTKLK